MRVSEMNWIQVESYLRDDDRCVVPLGSTEQHCYLSLSVDSILSERVAAEAAAPLGVPVFPVLAYGITPYFMAFPGSLTLRVETYLAVVRDLLDGLAQTGFRRILLCNGHGGNAPAAGFAVEWIAQHPDCRVRFHNWWSAPRTSAKAMEIDAIGSHASWSENFPWTRLGNVAVPPGGKPMINHDTLRLLPPSEVRQVLGDGNFGGLYQRPDAEMLALWEVAVAETRDLIEGPWGMSEPLLIWGAGAIGGTIGAHLARAGHDVKLVDADAGHVVAIRERGLIIEGPISNFTQKVSVATPDDVMGRFSRILLCVKAHHTETATRQLAPHLAEGAYVASFQNGLNEFVIGRIIGMPNVVGAFINFGADYLEPGRILFGGRGACVLGELDGAMTPRLTALHEVLTTFEPGAITTDNILGYLWGKLGYGALLFATALTDDAIADVLDDAGSREVLTRVAREVMAVAAAKRIAPQGFNGFDPAAFTPGHGAGSVTASMDVMVAFNRRSAKSHSGIWRDLAIRKRRTEVDAQLGPVVAEGAALGVPTPCNARLIAMIHEIEDGTRRLDRANLGELARVH